MSALSESSEGEISVEVADNSSDDEKKNFMGKALAAFREQYGDPDKGLSIVKVKKYLRSQYHVQKPEMAKLLCTVLEDAVERRILIKTTGKSVLSGSARLNPAYMKRADRPLGLEEYSQTQSRRRSSQNGEETASVPALG